MSRLDIHLHRITQVSYTISHPHRINNTYPMMNQMMETPHLWSAEEDIFLLFSAEYGKAGIGMILRIRIRLQEATIILRRLLMA